jgi:spore coat polysaccharide biosynthesis predicted glycosyltransferase SpsG
MNALIVCHLGEGIGLGHFSRSMVIAKGLTNKFNLNVEFLIQGNEFISNDLKKFNSTFININMNLNERLKKLSSYDLIFFDLNKNFIQDNLYESLSNLQRIGTKLIAIDGLLNFQKYLDLIFIPSFYLPLNKNTNINLKKIAYGWDSYLIDEKKVSLEWKNGNNILVLTGGSNTTKLSNKWIAELDSNLPNGSIINLVSGPFSFKQSLPSQSRIQIIEHQAPENLSLIMSEASYAVTVYGVTFFELLKIGIPTVVFSPYGNKDQEELKIIKKLGLAMVAQNEYDAVQMLIELMNDHNKARAFSVKSINQMKDSGFEKLASKIKELI